MKKSNKLLLGGFLAGLLLITALHLTLYAKYKAGDYTIYHEEEAATYSMQPFPNVLFVSVRNIPEATVKLSDVAGVEKTEEGDIIYEKRGDTLLIARRDSVNSRGAGNNVTFHLPANATLFVFNSSLSFKKGKKSIVSNPVIYLRKSDVLFSGGKDPLQLGQVKIFATEHSIASFQNNTQVDQLDVHLANSTVEYTEGNIGQLAIVTDSLSRISLQSKYLVKANIKTIAP